MTDHTINLRNQSRPDSPVFQAKYCDTFFSRFKGLMFSPPLPANSGILLVEQVDSRLNTSIHMFFMRFDIAVVWLNSEFKVVDVKIARRWQPYYAPIAPARFTFETNTENAHFFQVGDLIQVENAA